MSTASGEQFAQVGKLKLCYETFGGESDEPLLLVMGLASQMVMWDDEFCERLAERGFFVIRFDNRDVGRSTILRDAPIPKRWQLLVRDKRGASYSLDDMAADGIGLLDELGIESAHVVGASMGGMIAQTLAAEHPASVRSLVSIMSNTGSRWSGNPKLAIYRLWLSRPPRDRDSYIERATTVFSMIGSRGLPQDLERYREIAARSYDRGYDPAASARQLGAIFASGNRTKQLRSITAPTLVIHGSTDPMVNRSGGAATARAIPGARMLTIKGMGHDLPEAAWPQLLGAISEHASAAERARVGATQ
jgi:pimeloyl-ACP methyl ester carboxylesterase